MDLILNVDDYLPGRYARTRILEQAGFRVIEASTGQEALDLAVEHAPSMILLDVNLPDMSGFDVCRKMRLDPRIFSATILHISASNVASHHQIQGLEGGADSYLVEPIEPAVLVATIRAFFRAREAEEALRRSNEELERFGYRVAHDLNEPLRTMIAHTQLMQKELRGTNERVDQSLHFVIDASKRMHAFIERLLAYSQALHSAEETQQIDCEAIFRVALENLQSAIRESGAKVLHDPLPSIAAGPPLEQVFQNLISNAIKYAREGVAPEVHVSATREIRDNNDEWVFSVRDNGVGIEGKDLQSVFEIFHRLHGRDIPGSGIGLATCKKIVEAGGGRIWVDSRPGEGSTFRFTVPLQKAQAQPA